MTADQPKTAASPKAADGPDTAASPKAADRPDTADQQTNADQHTSADQQTSADRVRAVFRAEAGRLDGVLRELAPADWSKPTPCPPWTVAELLGHVVTAIAWLPDMLAAPAPPAATVSAAGYYRPDQRFSPRTNAERIALGQRRASTAAHDFGRTWRHVLSLCESEPPERVVRTRHGDPMLLSDFLLTRIVEVGVHGLDLAAALGRPPWLTREAAGLLADLLLAGPGKPAKRAAPGRQTTRTGTARQPTSTDTDTDTDTDDPSQTANTGTQTANALGWDPLTAVQKTTGRLVMTAAELRYLSDHRIHILALG